MFEINGIKYDFKVISVKQGLKAKTLLLKLANSMENGNIDEDSEEELYSLILDLLRVYNKSDKGKESVLEGLSMDQVGLIFNNPLAILDIQKSFSEVIMGFMQSLPSFQSSNQIGRVKTIHK